MDPEGTVVVLYSDQAQIGARDESLLAVGVKPLVYKEAASSAEAVKNR